MDFIVSVINLVNFFFCAAGIGICGLCFLHISGSRHLRKEVKRYFQIFFFMILQYIATHLARQLMDGLPGSGIRIALYIVTFLEVLTAGMMAHMMSMLILAAVKAEKGVKQLRGALLALLIAHAAILVASQFSELVYYFDANNEYHRTAGYLLCNLCPVAMMGIDIFLLIRYRKNLERHVKSAFWTYMVAPIAAIVIQGAFYGLQFIILTTVGAAVYMFSVIMQDLNLKMEKQREESSRIETELAMASSIQADMLPNIFPAFPERSDFDIYASMKPAKEVGGDFYDFFFTDENHLGIVMADVSGKGVPAALFMMISKTLVQNYATNGFSPKQVLEAMNRQICSNNREEMFVTVWLGILDLTTGVLTAANAGHEYPALKCSGGHFELLHDKHDFVIGGMNGVRYREYDLKLDPGSMLFVYTDGVVEATDGGKNLFSTDRMLEALRNAENGTAREVVDSVGRAVDDFVKDAPQFDDLTMLCLKYTGPQP